MINFIEAQSSWEGLPDLEQITLCAIITSTTPAVQDTFTGYTLYHVKRKPATRMQLELAGLTVSDENITFDLYQDDLNACGLPNPQQPFVSYQIIDQSFGSFTGNITLGGNTITMASLPTGIVPGMGIVGLGLPAGTTIQGIPPMQSTQMILSQQSTMNINGATFTAGDNWVVEKMTRVITKAKWVAVCKKAR